MADAPGVQELLDEMLDSERSPEEVCGAYPELLAEVRERWQQMCIVEAEIEALFPTPGHDPDADGPASLDQGAELPRIPGYEVEAVLGRGGMGVVYKARHLRLNRPVALKMLLAGAYAGPDERTRFHARSGGGGGPAACEHRAGLRRGRPGGPAVLHHGVRRGRQPGPEVGGHAAAGTPGRCAGWPRWPRPCRRRTRAASYTAT